MKGLIRNTATAVSQLVFILNDAIPAYGQLVYQNVGLLNKLLVTRELATKLTVATNLIKLLITKYLYQKKRTSSSSFSQNALGTSIKSKDNPLRRKDVRLKKYMFRKGKKVSFWDESLRV